MAIDFQGFLSPNSTPVPDELFDDLMSGLSGAELKVLLYIIRRTFGFKKTADNISLQQICKGIMTREGEILDKGTGLSLSTVQVALKGLIAKHCVLTTRNRSKEKGDQPTTFSLNIRTISHLTENQQGGIPIIGNGGYRNSVSQQTVQQQTAIQLRTSKANSQEGKHEVPPVPAAHPALPDLRGSTAQETIRAGESNTPYQSPQTQQTQQTRTGSTRTIGEILAAHQPPAQPPTPPQPQQPLVAKVAPTPQLKAAVESISAEFADTAHLRSNISQAANLWQASGRSEASFVSSLYEARSITHQQRNVRRPMPYFWTTLRDLLHLNKEDLSHEHATGG